ncbi:MAG: hypothetical protein QOK08_970 [Actinomycetota bacterium]|nr:hypothetical protein [Actinomycetota bacterium]
MQNQSTAFDPLAADAAHLVRTAGDDELLSLVGDLEEHGRRIDALRVTAAAEVAHRSRRELESAALSAKKGCRNASELMQRMTGASGRTVEVWLRLGKRLHGRTTLIGVEGPAEFPTVALALIEGRLGIDKACAIVSVLTPALTAASLDAVAIAESALVQDAPDFTADEVRIQAMVWRAAIDPDGIEPSEERAMASRGIRLGRVRDGIVPISGDLMPEVAGGQKRL